MTIRIHPSWYSLLHEEFEKPYWNELTTFVKDEYMHKKCFPEWKNIFRAYDLTPFENVKIVILGQDPYHTAYESSSSSWATRRIKDSLWADSSFVGMTKNEDRFLPAQEWQEWEGSQKPICAAMWLSFSTPEWSKPQPSLRNIFKELHSDLGIVRTKTDLTDWAEQGVLLLNAVLTVRQGEPASHKGKGWENFTDATIHALSEKWEHIVFILWGAYAMAKKSLIDPNKHYIITSPHPSPFSAHNGFFGSHPFSKANDYLYSKNKEKLNWEN